MEERLPPPPPPKRDRRKKKSVVLPLLLLMISFILILGLVGLVFVLTSFRAPKAVQAQRNSVLKLSLAGNIPEYEPATGLKVLMGYQPYYFYDYLALIEKAKNDPKVSGLYLEIQPLGMGFAQLSEMRAAISDFRTSGKWVVAYGEMWREAEYFLASSANNIYLTPESMLMLDGFMSRISFYEQALDWAGIKVDVAAFKEYKSFADSYRYTEMTDAHRESTTALLDAIHQGFVNEVALARHIEVATVEQALQTGTYQADQALALGLIDGIQYQDQVENAIRERLNLDNDQAVPFIEGSRYYVPNHGSSSLGSNQIALLLASGTINSGSADRGTFGDSAIGSDWFIEQIHQIRENKNIKAVVLRIDSPGGSGLASDVMWRELKNLQADGIPLVASMGNVAASGGYYLAMGCPTIFADPMTITGSNGVVAMRIDMSEFYQNVKVNVQVLKTGPNADFFDPYRPLSEEERQAFLERTGVFYQSFVQKAADSRQQSFDAFEPLAHGRVWVGSAALENGLADQKGGLMDAIHFAAEQAGLDRYSVHLYPGEKDFWALLQESQLQTKQESVIDQLIPPLAKRLIDLNVEHQPQPLALMPFELEIH